MPDIHADRVLILDFGAQYTQLIARRVRELGVYSEIYACDVGGEQIKRFAPQAIILSGGPESVYDVKGHEAAPEVFSAGVPVLGICYGMQTMAAQLGGQVELSSHREFGAAQVSVREALNILITEGFVTKGHGRSARVLRLTDAAIIHTYQVRGALEGLAARIIVEQKLSITDLEAAMVELRLAVETNDVRSVIDRVQRFHVCILAKPGNPFLLENGLRLIVPLYAFTLMRALAKGLDASPWVPQVANHQRIVDAIRMGNPQLAEQVVIHVTNRFMERYLEVWGN